MFACFTKGMKSNEFILVDPKFASGPGHTEDSRKLLFVASRLAFSIDDSVKTNPASSLVVTLEKENFYR